MGVIIMSLYFAQSAASYLMEVASPRFSVRCPYTYGYGFNSCVVKATIILVGCAIFGMVGILILAVAWLHVPQFDGKKGVPKT